MASYAPIPLGNGKFCYSGPKCKKHGRKTSIFRSVQDVFSKIEKDFPSKIEVSAGFTTVEFNTIAKAHFDSLNPKEKWAFHSYSDRAGSIRVNRMLEAKATLTPEMQQQVVNLDSAISKYSRPIEQELFRGSGHTPEEWVNLSSGNIIEMNSFVSTSASPTKAMEFAKVNSEPLLLRITTSTGAPIQSGDDEYEFLLPRGQKYQVVSFEKNVEVNATQPVYSDRFPADKKRSYKNVNVLTLRSI